MQEQLPNSLHSSSYEGEYTLIKGEDNFNCSFSQQISQSQLDEFLKQKIQQESIPSCKLESGSLKNSSHIQGYTPYKQEPSSQSSISGFDDFKYIPKPEMTTLSGLSNISSIHSSPSNVYLPNISHFNQPLNNSQIVNPSDIYQEDPKKINKSCIE